MLPVVSNNEGLSWNSRAATLVFLSFIIQLTISIWLVFEGQACRCFNISFCGGLKVI